MDEQFYTECKRNITNFNDCMIEQIKISPKDEGKKENTEECSTIEHAESI